MTDYDYTGSLITAHPKIIRITVEDKNLRLSAPLPVKCSGGHLPALTFYLGDLPWI
jgi:hypothetical protein